LGSGRHSLRLWLSPLSFADRKRGEEEHEREREFSFQKRKKKSDVEIPRQVV
jgi:hypothetical protein